MKGFSLGLIAALATAGAFLGACSSSTTLSGGLQATTVTNLTINCGSSDTASVTVSGGSSPYHYEWYKKGASSASDSLVADKPNIDSSTGTHTFSNVCPAVAGSYYVKTTDASSRTVTSSDFTVTVNGSGCSGC